MKGFLAFPALLILLFGTPTFADYQKGLDAAKSGDYATALKEWRPLAKKGMAAAQYNLGKNAKLIKLEGRPHNTFLNQAVLAEVSALIERLQK